MTTPEALIAFTLAAGLLTLTPGLDTALVIRTAAAEGPRRAAGAAIGIGLGCLIWGAAASFGVGALLTASQTAYTVLKWVGALYLAWTGLRMILKPREAFEPGETRAVDAGPMAALRRGLLTNLLNPKVGIFYVSFLPQFMPVGVDPARFGLLLTTIHVVEGLLWFALLIAATVPIAGLLRLPGVVRWLDRTTGLVFVAFGLRLALDRR
ncbi:LysE family translocator [Caulobacter vibrioides]|uniref:Efflux protein, LysE family n=2 Tax=Caulobacter vibrioides TaxID=155892 RepID=Q9AAY6_CAUVC|nr:LysE family translocator [Caulobacter vibrioides]YP_002515861.1 amino acid efflux permease [Caulobacter vibrioides NA1000]AAK22443.1 efflux protein, LysE family [Caulobacter vibrioides CB15]ACL93953.1 amino acid efflux permease [Caulobacter vibrioides NA1000]ATC23469.1 LysE family translocator [Caulobacter vibrioides]ATC27304.1 LysE family translocator [Caulobacter vibrioides]PLR11944.1 LysE family translocator [Caulobacter vibrioides]